jgi:hypothetical protein
MLYSTAYDVAAPGLILGVLAAGIVALIVVTLIIAVIEALILRALKWGTFGRSLLAALTANGVSTLAGVGAMLLTNLGLWWLLLAYGLSVLIEGGILTLFKRGASRENWIAAFAMNSASYVPLFLLVLAGRNIFGNFL